MTKDAWEVEADAGVGNVTPRGAGTTAGDIDIPDSLPADRPTRVLVVCADERLREDTVMQLEQGSDGEWEADAAPDTDTARLKLIIEEWAAVVLRLDGGDLDHRAVCRGAHTARRMRRPSLVAVAVLDFDLERELSSLGIARILRPSATGDEIADAVRDCLNEDDPRPDPGSMWDGESRE